MKKRVSLLGIAMILSTLTVYPVFAGNITGCNGILGDGVVLDSKFPQIVSLIIKIIQIAVPIILVIFGMLDLFKGVMAQKDDEIKKGQQTFLKRVIAAAIVFFVVSIVKLLFSFLASGEDKESMMDCVNCFLNGPESTYCATEE